MSTWTQRLGAQRSPRSCSDRREDLVHPAERRRRVSILPLLVRPGHPLDLEHRLDLTGPLTEPRLRKLGRDLLRRLPILGKRHPPKLFSWTEPDYYLRAVQWLPQCACIPSSLSSTPNLRPLLY